MRARETIAHAGHRTEAERTSLGTNPLPHTGQRSCKKAKASFPRNPVRCGRRCAAAHGNNDPRGWLPPRRGPSPWSFALGRRMASPATPADARIPPEYRRRRACSRTSAALPEATVVRPRNPPDPHSLTSYAWPPAGSPPIRAQQTGILEQACRQQIAWVASSSKQRTNARRRNFHRRDRELHDLAGR